MHAPALLTPVRRPVDLLASATLALAIAAAVAVAGAAALGLEPHIEASDSMRPAVRAGDALWLSDIRASEARVGDVIAFAHPDRGDAVLHRVVARRRSGKRIAFVTRGDANSGVERWTIPPSGSLGRYSGWRVPHAGRLVGSVLGPLPAGVTIASALALAVILLRRIWR